MHIFKFVPFLDDAFAHVVMLNLKVNQHAVPSRGALKLLRNTVIRYRLALMQLLSGQQRVGCGHSRGETLTPAKPSFKKKKLW